MASSTYEITLICPMCYKAEKHLFTHLQKKCGKNSSTAEIRRLVREAENSLRTFIKKDRIVDYVEIASLHSTNSFISFLENKGLIVRNKPAGALRSQDAEEADTGSEEGSPEELVEDSAEDQRFHIRNWKLLPKKKMKEAGLYYRHSTKTPVLKNFGYYLRNTLRVPKYKQEVENVSRFLFFIDKKRVSLNFVKEVEKTSKFFCKLRRCSLKSQTAVKYLKSIRRFLKYNLRATNLAIKRPKLYKHCVYFLRVLEDTQKQLSKEVCKEMVSKRYSALIGTCTTPQECRRLLNVARPPFLQAIRDAKNNKKLHVNHQLDILYYLESLLILKHLQRPGVVKNMTVTEWHQRVRHKYSHQGMAEEMVIVGVKNHKTATQQVATFALTEEEEMWFTVYYEKIRPALLTLNSPQNAFFLSSTGMKIYNVSNDLQRYHKKFDLPNITSQLIRRTCETWTVSRYTDSERCLVAKYLSHGSITAEKTYREKTLSDICHASKLVAQVGTNLNQNQDSASREEHETHKTREQQRSSEHEQTHSSRRECPCHEICQTFSRLKERTSKHGRDQPTTSSDEPNHEAHENRKRKMQMSDPTSKSREPKEKLRRAAVDPLERIDGDSEEYKRQRQDQPFVSRHTASEVRLVRVPVLCLQRIDEIENVKSLHMIRL